jgi:hypothetical protein
VHRACHGGRVVAGQRHPQVVGGAGGVAGEQHALERRLPLAEARLERLALPGEAGGLGTQAASVGLQPGERAVGLRDRALGGAQRVARFLARAFLFLELARERVDAAAQRLQILLARLAERVDEKEREERGEGALQALAFPWLATAARRRESSAGSPR